jgi:hypothetical protein
MRAIVLKAQTLLFSKDTITKLLSEEHKEIGAGLFDFHPL